MGEGGYRPIEKLDVFLTYESVTNRVWNIVTTWPLFAKDTIGKQLVRSVDSIGANLVEGDGRGTDPDSIRFFRYARLRLEKAGYGSSEPLSEA